MKSNNICIQDARWLAIGEQPGSGETDFFPPQVAEERWVELGQWHSFSVGSRIWVLYQPPMSYANGWPDSPAELDESGLIECSILDFAPFWLAVERQWGRPNIPDGRTALRSRGGDRTSHLAFNRGDWPNFPPHLEVLGPAFVRCERIILLKDIPLHFPEEKDVFEPDNFPSNRVFENSTQSEHLFYGGKGVEGGYQWWVRTKETPSRVVLHAFELMGQGLAQICNRLFHSSG